MGQNADIVRRAFDAFSRRDLNVLLTLADPEIEFMPATARVAGRAEPYRGHDGLRTYLADVARRVILVVLDMSRKVLPIGTPENYLFVLGPRQHGMSDSHYPTVVVTLVINGNLPVPSSWSRRKTPTTDTPGTPEERRPACVKALVHSVITAPSAPTCRLTVSSTGPRLAK